MEFCEVCDNMLYLEVTPEKHLKTFCKNCNFTAIRQATSSIAISKKNFTSDANSFKAFMNPNIKYDYSLPRVNNVECPSCQPKQRQSKDNEVIYIKYDHDNMRYLYFCCHCDHFWKN